MYIYIYIYICTKYNNVTIEKIKLKSINSNTYYNNLLTKII